MPEVLLCEATDINLDICLDKGGQSFTWIRISDHQWLNVINNKIVILVRANGKIYLQSSETDQDLLDHVKDYFRLDYDLRTMYHQWSSVDDHFKSLAPEYPAIRLLRQDPVETLFSFICSQNNAIPRITKMVQHLKVAYGEPLGEIHGVALYAFPNIERLAVETVERDLRDAGFGYRAKYIRDAARHLIDTGLDLHSLRKEPYLTVHERLVEIPGIGPKVADCIALMSLDQLGAVPVDTHIWQLACKQYRFSGLPKAKSSMNKTAYHAVGGHFREIFGDHAGWAHLVLFAAQSRARGSLRKTLS